MKTIQLAIPFQVLSTSVNPLGDKEERVVTPFGCVDVVFKAPSKTAGPDSRREIQVGGDVDCWLVDEAVFNEFKTTFVRLIKGILRDDLDALVEKPNQLYVRFKGETLDITLPWQSGDAPITNAS